MAVPKTKTSIDNDILTVTDVVNMLKDGKNVLFTGAGGCGKSFALREVATLLLADDIKVAITATTGIASLSLSVPGCISTTFHRFAGIEMGQGDRDELLATAQKKKAMSKWKKTQILIIDEISMFGKELFEKVEYVARKMRGSIKPFGGMTVLASGDFLQLPPVKDKWIFDDSDVWDAMDFHPIIFSTPVRFTDKSYYELLMRVRSAVPSIEDRDLILERVNAYDELMKTTNGDWSQIKPTVLYSKKIDVESYNNEEMAKLPFPKKFFNAVDTFVEFKDGAKETYYKRLMDENVPETIVLKQGAQVVLKANIDTDQGLANGSRGVIMEIGIDFCDVKFMTGKVHRISVKTWELKDKTAKYIRLQIPLRLAYSSTIHSVQGCTLDCVVMDLGPSIFSAGQAYVALSRARNTNSLYISDFSEKAIKSSKKALNYDKYLSTKGKKINIIIDEKKD